jgi:Domain of unknown function (DUF6265)
MRMTTRIGNACLMMCVLVLAERQAHGQSAAVLPASVSALSWMAGAWGGTVDGMEMEEHWTTAKGGSLIGMHRDIAKGRTVSFEFLRVEEQDGGLVYLSSPKGAAVTRFRLVEAGPMRAVFANPQHDFPQRIIYWKDGADLRARIEGPQGGKTVGEEWRWAPLNK